MKEKPEHVNQILEKISKTENELGEYCINQVAKNLKQNGYKDARTWATTITSALLGDFKKFEGAGYFNSLTHELKGPEKNAAKAIHNILSNLENNLEADPEHVKDTLIYSVSKALDKMDKEKYRRIYR